MKLFIVIWASGFVGWDVACAFDAAKEGDWRDAMILASIAGITALLGAIGYNHNRQPVR